MCWKTGVPICKTRHFHYLKAIGNTDPSMTPAWSIAPWLTVGTEAAVRGGKNILLTSLLSSISLARFGEVKDEVAFWLLIRGGFCSPTSPTILEVCSKRAVVLRVLTDWRTQANNGASSSWFCRARGVKAQHILAWTNTLNGGPLNVPRFCATWSYRLSAK